MSKAKGPRKNRAKPNRPLDPLLPCGLRRGMRGQMFRRGPGYDRLPSRRFSFVPLWGLPMFLVYAPRRVDCPRCRVKVEAMPWTLPSNPKSPLTETLSWFLAGWAKRLSWKETAEAFHMTWDAVYQSVAMAVSWGREHMDRSGCSGPGCQDRFHDLCQHILEEVVSRSGRERGFQVSEQSARNRCKKT